MKKSSKNLIKNQKIALLLLLILSNTTCSRKEDTIEELRFKNDFDEQNIKASNIEQINMVEQTELSQMIQIKKFLEEQDAHE